MYNDGKYQAAIDLLDEAENREDCAVIEEAVESCRIKAWCYYYLAIKGDKGESKEIIDKMKKVRAGTAIMFGGDVLCANQFPKKVLSAYNVLPLAEWVMGYKRMAWHYSDIAVLKFPDEASAWGTRGNLMKWAGNFEGSIEVFDKVTETALMDLDFRNAGHGQQNKGDSLYKLRRFGGAREAYANALKLYGWYEFRGGKATAHIQSTQNKLDQLN